jgi:hypothetical protein
MRITEGNLIYFSTFVAEYKNRKDAFREFQKRETEGAFTNKKEVLIVENNSKKNK